MESARIQDIVGILRFTPFGVTPNGVGPLSGIGSDPPREKGIQKEIFCAVSIENVSRIEIFSPTDMVVLSGQTGRNAAC